ncbi:MAG: UbiX family flavin prenyltransferase [Hydrogenobaculum sp.]|jgi:polyprenyl P-hydroxybenzoate and phenylacrylic acid decarboxylases|uniref:UbiX family flavin prenyltransferase n=1 Tax=unclassified Hydrogenobaculum TaxID=2622382 RepID=UPI0001C51EC1|nr:MULTISPECIES: UbiX family flavin prenyltransferase [unclassified Hydrogenobaculum]AEF19850.1 3-octaprenyl-4-hydroxybenzoate carboxy-lyase [Hydrogenobaculum sp. 3684]AEG47136.1 3-octaprenyl-4-hydroxybenzoate carboxy-lyase [Hydrogenobaculum sp. SHO]AGG15784.1 3-octaprenyl-4-hydroxybenzoate carboxy-lyase [Hydrogenobaculum sp. HO]AGH94084.1 polyprenyl p-hydroxybenzoate/phenylacrylic acid decarboxylase [Hydrogenobaculum sp. SN]
MKESIALLITGASGSIYAVRTFEVLKERYDLHVVMSKTAKYVMGYETGVGEEFFKKEAHVYDYTDFAAPISSGSFLCKFKGVLVVPCSMGTLGAVASGVAQNLIHRVCDTALKERVPLVMLVREMPYNSIHLENMLKLTNAGAIIMSASPGFYHKPKTLEESIDFVVGKVLDTLRIDHNIYKRWKSS